MDAVEKGKLHFTDMFGDGLVRRQHELLNDPVRNTALLFDDVDRFSLEIEDDLRFGQIEVKAPPLQAASVQLDSQLLHRLEHRDKRAVAAKQFGIFIDQDSAH